jgi:hypothetical protein
MSSKHGNLNIWYFLTPKGPYVLGVTKPVLVSVA